MDLSRYDFICQKALQKGLQYARSLGHENFEVEHICLAIIRGDLMPGKEFPLASAQQALEQYLGQIPKIFGQIKVGFSLRLDAALTRAERADASSVIDIDLLWDSLFKESTLLQNVKAHADQERQRQKDFVPLGDHLKTTKPSKNKSDKSAKTPPMPLSANTANVLKQKTLPLYTTDLSELAERDELDPVIGRDMEVRRILEILGRKKKNNPVLLGEPGVGKTAIAEALALRIVQGKVPESVRDKRILSLDLGALLAGAKFRGEFEDRLKKLMSELALLNGKVILFIDEMHMLVGAGNLEGGVDAANLLKPALARGEIHCIGATTLSEYRRFIEKDAALERRFQPVTLEEPSKEVSLSILRGLKQRYEIFHGIRINDRALVAAVELSTKFIPQRKLPDKAIDLVDEAASRLRLQIDSMPAELETLKAQLEQIELEKKALSLDVKNKRALTKLEVQFENISIECRHMEDNWRAYQNLLENIRALDKQKEEANALLAKARQLGNLEFASAILYQQIPQLDQQLKDVRKQLGTLQDKNSYLVREVGEREVAEVVAAWTKIPMSKLLRTEDEKLKNIETQIAARVFGQQHAIDNVGRYIKRARIGLNDPNRPWGVFLFLGPTGVGKTEMAKALAHELFDDEKKMIRIDMSEFMEAHNVARLIGSPPGYVGFDQGGELTEAIKNKPHSVILLDELEKAHPKVLDILLQIFDDGRLTDARGKVFDFRNSLIIMTSNLVVPLHTSLSSRHSDDENIRRDLQRFLRAEFINRIDEVVVFNSLGKKHFIQLVARLETELNAHLAARELRVTLGEQLRKRLVDSGLQSAFGGRAVRRNFQSLITDAVSKRIFDTPHFARGAWILELDSEGELQWQEENLIHRYLPAAN